MPKIGGNTQIKRVELPAVEGEDDRAWCEIRTGVTFGDVVEMQKGLTEAEQSEIMLSRLIQDWNFTEDGTANTPKLDITPAAIHAMSGVYALFLAEWVEKNVEVPKQDEVIGADEKKSSSSTSAAASMDSGQVPPESPPITIPIS